MLLVQPQTFVELFSSVEIAGQGRADNKLFIVRPLHWLTVFIKLLLWSKLLKSI